MPSGDPPGMVRPDGGRVGVENAKFKAIVFRVIAGLGRSASKQICPLLAEDLGESGLG
jgi:hypothetical protein